MFFRDKLGGIKSFFTKQPLPSISFYVNPRYLCGIQISRREKRLIQYFIIPLEKLVIEPSFLKKNLKDTRFLNKILREEIKKFHPSEKKIALLLPELSQRTFVFSFDSLPPSPEEKEKLIFFRIKRQIPFLPDDARFSFELIGSKNSPRIIVSVARASIIEEYEMLFRELKFEPGIVGIPTLSLLNASFVEENSILVNVEEDSLNLLSIIDSEVVLYRQKSFAPEFVYELSWEEKIDQIVKEIENTANFLEDKEKRKVDSLTMRLGLLNSRENLLSSLRKRLSYPLKEIDVSFLSTLNQRERHILSPLFGQISSK